MTWEHDAETKYLDANNDCIKEQLVRWYMRGELILVMVLSSTQDLCKGLKELMSVNVSNIVAN